MKFLILSMSTIASLSLIGEVNAKIFPELDTTLPKTSNDCLTWAGSRALELGLCDDLKNCEVNHSDDEGSLRECLGESYRKYELSHTQGKLEEEIPYAGQELPVSTESENSDYELFDRKGWEKSHQGD